MKAYCINLDRRPDRLHHMTQQFQLQGASFERISAIDGTEPSVIVEAISALPTALGPRISVGAFACFQSHRKAWKALLSSKASYGVILEDDLLLAEGFSTYFLDDWVPDDADIVRLETFHTRVHVDSTSIHVTGTRKLQRLRSSHLGAGCYVLSSRAAHYLYEKTVVIRDPVDVFLFSDTSDLFSDLVTYQMVPAPAVQGKRDGSELKPTKWAVSNIQERFDTEVSPHALRSESTLMRLRRRIRESVRAQRQETRYIVVPFG